MQNIFLSSPRYCDRGWIVFIVYLWRYPFGPHVTSTLLTIPLLYGRWSTCGSDRGNAYFFTATSTTIEGTGEKRTNEQTLGVNSSAEGELCNIVHVQTNASVDSRENSTKLLECRLIWTRSSFIGLDPLSCRLVSLLSRVDCFCPSSLANCSLLSPFASLSNWCPLTTSGHVECYILFSNLKQKITQHY